MSDDAADIVFLDCETLGLDPTAPIWEFAAARRDANGRGFKVEMFIQHDPAKWLDDADYPESFQADYRTRFNRSDAIAESQAAQIIEMFVDGAVVHASNPAFDMERIELLLQRNRITPGWHYHPIDVPTLVMGYLAARNELPDRPWKSDALSKAAGVDPADFARHTAMGDVLWTVAQYDVVMGVDEA